MQLYYNFYNITINNNTLFPRYSNCSLFLGLYHNIIYTIQKNSLPLLPLARVRISLTNSHGSSSRFFQVLRTHARNKIQMSREKTSVTIRLSHTFRMSPQPHDAQSLKGIALSSSQSQFIQCTRRRLQCENITSAQVWRYLSMCRVGIFLKKIYLKQNICILSRRLCKFKNHFTVKNGIRLISAQATYAGYSQ